MTTVHTKTTMGNPLRQGSAEWLDMRLGIPTCSRLFRILTPAQLKYSAGARGFAAELIGERILGAPLEGYDGGVWTDRGTLQEDDAKAWYAFHRDVDVTDVPFATKEVVRVDKEGEPIIGEDGELITDIVGGSPDGAVGSKGGIEIKVRSAKHHMRCITGVDEIADRLQTQGYIWLMGWEWIDVVAYNDSLPKKIVRQYAEPDVQAAITDNLQRFFRELALAERKLADLGDVIEEDEDVKWDLMASLETEATPA